MKNAFKYTGWTSDLMTVSLGERHFMIQSLENNTFEVYTEGGSHGIFKSLGKAMTHAETFLKRYTKDND